MGFFYLGDDANTYLAKMRQGWEGAWGWQNRYTTESSPVAYLFMFWIVIGHFAAILHLPLMLAFHLARVAGAFALMAAAWLMICHFIEDRSARRFAFFFLAVGLGLGYVIQALGHPVIFGNVNESRPTIPCRWSENRFAFTPCNCGSTIVAASRPCWIRKSPDAFSPVRTSMGIGNGV